MRKQPKPTHLRIELDEWQVARGKVDAVDISVSWRGAKDDPALAGFLEELPPREKLVSIKLADGRTELAPEAWRNVQFGDGPSVFESARTRFDDWGKVWTDGSHLTQARTSITDMIRRYVPGFDDYADKEQIDFIIRTQQKINEVRDSVEALVLHLEYAAPDKHKAVPPQKNPLLNIQAAVFSDVMGSSRRAGELLDVPLAPSDKDRNENETVRKRAMSGRQLLRSYFGEAEWETKVARMREYRRWWEQFEASDNKEKVYALLARAHETSLEHERLSAESDGFDKKVDKWIAVVEARSEARKTLLRSDDVGRRDDASRTYDRLWAEQVRIQDSDERLGKALTLFNALTNDQP